jgi:hypothetical protein
MHPLPYASAAILVAKANKGTAFNRRNRPWLTLIFFAALKMREIIWG